MIKGPLVWLVVLGALAFATAVLMAFGLSFWAALLLAILFGCVVAVIWVLAAAPRILAPAGEPVPETEGVLMNWAAPFYEEMCRLFGIGRGFRGRTLDLMRLRTGERVIDVGCGTGVVSRLAADSVGPSGAVIGIDPSAAMIGQARRKAARAGSRAEFRLAAAENLPFPDGSFDVAVVSFVLHHLPPAVKRAGLREIFRVLKPGGRLVVVDIDRPRTWAWWIAVWPLWFVPSITPQLRGEVARYIEEAGFRSVTVSDRRARVITFWSAARPAAGAT